MKFDDPKVQQLRKFWPFQIVAGKENSIVYQIPWLNDSYKRIKPEYVNEQILKYLVKSASIKLGKNIKKAVIPVPDSYNEQQRRAILDTSIVAGLDIVKILNESIAALGSFRCLYNIQTDNQ